MARRSQGYPFTPRSTARLLPGQLFSFPLSDGGYGCCQVVPGMWPYQPPTRTRFRAGLLGWRGAALAVPTEVTGCRIIAYGWAHVGLFAAFGTEVIGKAPLAEERPGGVVDDRMWGIDGLYLLAPNLLAGA
jgi:hypothetical protein